MTSTITIIENNTLEIVNRILAIKGMNPATFARVDGYSNQSESIYVNVTHDEIGEIRFSDHRDCHPDSCRMNVQYSELESMNIIAESPNWEAKFDDDYDYEIWSSEEKSYNDEAFIYVK
jgi:hypothetical protein